MLTLPNIITLFRIPLALFFLYDNITIRIIVLILAMLSDGLDGYLARRYKKISRIGTFLDPLADKIFVFSILGIFLYEQKILPWEAAAMLCRDFSVIIFGCYLFVKGVLGQYQFRAIYCGKVMTTFQFIVLIALTCNVQLSPYAYLPFILIGLAALIELYIDRAKIKFEN